MKRRCEMSSQKLRRVAERAGRTRGEAVHQHALLLPRCPGLACALHRLRHLPRARRGAEASDRPRGHELAVRAASAHVLRVVHGELRFVCMEIASCRVITRTSRSTAAPRCATARSTAWAPTTCAWAPAPSRTRRTTRCPMRSRRARATTGCCLKGNRRRRTIPASRTASR